MKLSPFARIFAKDSAKNAVKDTAEDAAKDAAKDASGEQAVLAAAVREAVASALEEEVAHLAIAVALRDAACDQIPEQGPSLYEFVTGPLHRAIQNIANVEGATVVAARLLAILAARIAKPDAAQSNTSGIRPLVRPAPSAAGPSAPAPSADAPTEAASPAAEAPIPPPPGPTVRPPSPPVTPPPIPALPTNELPLSEDDLIFSDEEVSSAVSAFTDDQPTHEVPGDPRVLDPTTRETIPAPPAKSASVLLFTKDRHVSLVFALLLRSDMALEVHEDISRLIEVLDSSDLTQTIVILDFRRDPLPSNTLAKITPHLPYNLPVVLWGDEAALRGQSSTLGQHSPQQWVTCSAAVDPEDMAALIRCAIRRIAP